MDELAQKYRKHFPILDTSCYMISNSLGAMPADAEKELMHYTHEWKTEGVEAWHSWFPLVDRVSGLFGKIIGAEAEDVTLIHNLTIGSALVASCLDFSGKRNKVVFTELHFPTISYLWHGWQNYGAKVHLVKSDDGITTDVQKIIDAIDEETLIVPISHVYFRSGALQDIKLVIEKAHSVGALVMIDSYQAAGVVPIDVKALNVDILASGVLKWLCGGPGAAFMYVRRDLQERFRPAIRGWLGDKEPFDFIMPDVNFAQGMHRFLTSSIQVPCLYTAIPALKMMGETGIETIRKKSLLMTQRIFDKCDEYGFKANTPREAHRRGGHVTVDPNGIRQSKLSTKEINDELIRRRFTTDYRPPFGIRIAPHFYNTMDEVDSIMEEMKKLTA
ncbi:MAG: aminotransferase class V-fold PLP-dependent enzyme [Bacteroidota bacterium]|nr:aminotransferase class V-fold PLP-dependent enzyme [Bacteroidota bacterium]MDP4231225.1 aminotransferase class V-fold PLP-dependent enzyme [Bacteroidota bacterium]MDP4236998.1 aminotransferase class V-fold PLP-dependent enzyme [Bacteroidota bacterium]